MANIYSYRHPLNMLINIYYLNDISDTVNVATLNTYIDDIYNNIKKYIPDFFDGITLNIWNPSHPDIPHTTQICDTKTGVCYKDLQIAEYAGLNWATIEKIDLNGNFTKDDNELSHAISHELGHQYDYSIDLNLGNDIITPEWLSIRAIDNTPETPKVELFAEDFRYFFGSRVTKGFDRGTQRSPSLVRGLRDMMLIWHPVSEMVVNYRKAGARIFDSNVTYKYSNTDFNYFAVQFCVEETNFFNVITKLWIWVDRFAIYHWKNINNKYQWVKVKSF